MKARILHKLKGSFLLFLYLLLGQFIASALLLMVAMLVLALGAFGVIPLVGRTPLWAWVAGGTLIGLCWLAMGRFVPRAARPGPVGTAVVLTVWAVLASLMRTVYLLFSPQEFCGGMLGQTLELFGYDYLTARELGVTIACFLLPAVLGAGLFLGRKRVAAAGQEG